jgi:hypothetical protein
MAVLEDDAEIITQTVGTFYRRDSRPTQKTLNGVTYDVPARQAVALRGPRFPGRPLEYSMRVTGGGVPDQFLRPPETHLGRSWGHLISTAIDQTGLERVRSIGSNIQVDVISENTFSIRNFVFPAPDGSAIPDPFGVRMIRVIDGQEQVIAESTGSRMQITLPVTEEQSLVFRPINLYQNGNRLFPDDLHEIYMDIFIDTPEDDV